LRADPGAVGDQARVAVMLHTMKLLDAPDEYYQPLAEAWQGAAAGQVVLSEEQKAFVRTVKSRIGVDFRRWEEVNVLVDQLSGEDEPARIASSLATNNLRNVIVAAWQVRIRLSRDFAADCASLESAGRRAARRRRYADDLRNVAERTRATCIAVIDRPGPGTGSVLPEAGRPPLIFSPASSPDFGPGKSLADHGTEL
jgi:hypothetical protein